MKHRYCISAFVFGDYVRYIPFYVFSAGVSHPDVDVIIFIDHDLDDEMLSIIQEINDRHNNIKIIRVNIPEIEIDIIGGSKKLYRWIIPERYFLNYDYVYFGDVDIFLLLESPSLFKLHKKQMDIYNCCFSNKVRYSGGENQKRLTGLHFINRKRYYSKAGKLINTLFEDKNELCRYCHGINRDEEFLYKIVNDTIGIEPEIFRYFERPWHGIHFGGSKNFKVDIERTKSEISLPKDEVKKQLLKHKNDYLFNLIINKYADKKVLPYLKYYGYIDSVRKHLYKYYIELIKTRFWNIVLRPYSFIKYNLNL